MPYTSIASGTNSDSHLSILGTFVDGSLWTLWSVSTKFHMQQVSMHCVLTHFYQNQLEHFQQFELHIQQALATHEPINGSQFSFSWIIFWRASVLNGQVTPIRPSQDPKILTFAHFFCFKHISFRVKMFTCCLYIPPTSRCHCNETINVTNFTV